MSLAPIHIDQTCTHCGDDCNEAAIKQNQHLFCCNGCQMVYNILQDQGMGDYYRYEQKPGTSQRKKTNQSFDYLDNDQIRKALLEFQEGGISKVSFLLPQIHCSACLWLLEHLSRFNDGIIKCAVNFQSKKATITYKDDAITLREVVELLSKIGYEPTINYNRLDTTKVSTTVDKTLFYKLGLAGFSFGNIMLLSFPEYLGFDKASYLFSIGYINIALAIPVLLYSGVDYLKSALRGLRIKEFNIDLPIALGMLALFGRSLFDIISKTGEGYLDSFAGFIFFLLIGRWFQSFTYKALDFDRNYKSYFPISATIKSGKQWITKSIDALRTSDVLLIRNQEIIPADATLTKGIARLNYSFVTGESHIIKKQIGEEVFAGAKHQGDSIEVEVTKPVDQSYLTQLWNDDTFKKQDYSQSSKLIAVISKWFTYAIILIATLTMLYWVKVDTYTAINAFTAVLIVACPCALALTIPFTYGNILRLLSRQGFFLKNVQTIEHIQEIDYVIFDKTGTITDSKQIQVDFVGNALSNEDKVLIKSLCNKSTHPLSKAISKHLAATPIAKLNKYEEIIGSGLSAYKGTTQIRIGSAKYIFKTNQDLHKQGVFIEINGKYIGHFEFKHAFRDNVQAIFNSLEDEYQLAILSGDMDYEAKRIKNLVGDNCAIHFNQSPKDKLNKIKQLQSDGHKVMMVGDGLNDAGALKQANIGLVISDDENNFSPACDGILKADKFRSLYDLLKYIKLARLIIYGAFFLAFMYNSIGLYYAMSGQLSPIIAAILMPLSSITVITYSVITSWAFSKNSLR